MKLLERLCKTDEQGITILVEGKKDLFALRRLGVRGRIVCVKNSGKVLVDSLDEVQSEEVILLVDFDEYGKNLAKDIVQYLERRSVKVDSAIWREVKALVKKDVKDIEGLPSYLEKLKKHIEY
jgi:5S rRNA maturation endonuclease (ribonuclease M5)